MQLLYQFFYARYQVWFYFCWIRRILNYEKVPKYDDKDFLKIFVYSLYFQWCLNLRGKVPSFAQKCYFAQKTTNWKSSTFSTVKIWSKPTIQNSSNTKHLKLELFTRLICFIFLSWLEKCFEVTKIFHRFNSEGNWTKLRQKFCLLRQSWKKYLIQTKEIR